MLWHAQGETQEARKHYQAALRLNPRAGLAANNLADILAGEGRELDRALKLAVQAYRERPGDASVLDTIGWLHYRKKNYGQAASLLATAHRLRPRDPVIAFHYGMALAATKGRQTDAKRVLEQLLERSPNFPDASRIRQTIEKL
jgi:tetratricopeptide (TPR) repeat protein